MASGYGDFTAKTVKQGHVAVTASKWVPLVANTTVTNGDSTGQTPMQSRRHLRYQLQSNPGGAMAVTYVQKNLDGTYTTPTTSTSVKHCTVATGNTVIVEPVSDVVNVYGKLVAKAGFSDSSIRVICTEYA